MAVIGRALVLQAGATLLLIGAAVTPAVVAAQQVTPAALDSARKASTQRQLKSPQVAAALGFAPGVGHLYAGEVNRGWLIAAWYWTGVAIGHGGRTDTAGKVGGVMLVSGLLAGIVDGANAARRHNQRVRRAAMSP